MADSRPLPLLAEPKLRVSVSQTPDDAMLAARLLLLLALASVVLGEHYYVWTQTTDGAWGFLNFYPKALTINPGDYVTVLQNNDAGIIAITNDTNVPLSPFFPPGPSNLCQPSPDPTTARYDHSPVVCNPQ